MSVEVTLLKRDGTTGQYPQLEDEYIITGAEDAVAARLALYDASPAWLDPYGTGLYFLPRQNVDCRSQGRGCYQGFVTYTAHLSDALEPEGAYGFDIGGGTEHISYRPASYYGARYPSDSAPDLGGGLNVDVESRTVHGVDILVPTYEFHEDHTLAPEVVTPTYKGLLKSLVGKVNDALFKGVARGECMFIGVSGRRRALEKWALSYRFAAKENLTDITIGSIAGIEKEGWHHIHVLSEPAVSDDGKVLIMRPKYVYVDQVYAYGDFSQIGIGV